MGPEPRSMDNQNSKIMWPDLHGHLFSEEERQERLQKVLKERPPGPLWVFAFGSLMWNPCFEFERCETAVFEGWERKFHIWTTIARGTRKRPGLGLCIEKGENSCKGLVYQLLEVNAKDDWQKLWDREMVSGIYQAIWADLTLEGGEIVKALTFVVDRSHRQYAGGMSISEMSKIIAGAAGKYGACSDYLRSTVEELKKIDVEDAYLDSLLSAVEKQQPN